MAQKTWALLSGWKSIAVLPAVLTSGEGTPCTCTSPIRLTPFGRSVHNTRIERLWYDVTNGYGRKWKSFFMELEAHHGLDASIGAHIWLLHHLFLPSINQDALEWAESWNAHQLTLPTGGARSPRDMFIFGLLEYGTQGIDGLLQQEETVDNLEAYGVDWETMDNTTLMAHYREHNNEAAVATDHPFAPTSAPPRLSEVTCDEPGCPFTAEQVRELDARLARTVDLHSREMEVRQGVWSAALQLCLAGGF